MAKLEDFYMTPYRERTNKKRKIIIIISLLSVALIIGICVGWYYGKGTREKTLKVPDNKVRPYICSDVPDELKYDCYPDAPVDETECTNRGCCYSAQENVLHNSSFPPLNVPYCYYPTNYTGYVVKDVIETSRRTVIKLQRVQKSGFVKDIFNINVLVFYIDDSSLRIKVCFVIYFNMVCFNIGVNFIFFSSEQITDADSERYEVPTQLHYQTKELDKPLYKVNITETGLLKILRKNTDTIM